ncbi:hypothetical protein BFW01_g10080 [Lasiodiplodia theobromae]|nr:hypothetical protein BFW01_g10080 [Lasiodiplodia theobromae]
MTIRAVREYLSQPNPVIDNRIDKASSVSNEDMEDWPEVPKATKLRITSAYIEDSIRWLLDAKLDLPDDNAELADTAKIAFDERSFEHTFTRGPAALVANLLVIMGKALAHVPEYPQLCLVSGSSGKSDNKIGKPDWAVVPSTTPARKIHTNKAPGDTKGTKKEYEPDKPLSLWAEKYFRQMSHYMKERRTRYSWIITPKEIMIIRRRTSQKTNEVIPQVAKFSWVPKRNQKMPVAVVLFFIVFASGLNNGVQATYEDFAVENMVVLEKIKAAVERL